MIHNDQIEFNPAMNGTVSVFAYGGRAEKVSIKGLKYEIDNAALDVDFPIGTSNAFTGRKAAVSVGEGTLLICLKWQDD